MLVVRPVTALILGLFMVISFSAYAVDPLTGPNYDKQMVIDLEAGPFGMTVGMFAACAQERVMGIVRDGNRNSPGKRVKGEDLDGNFVITVPGVNADILFYFEPVEGGEQLFLARMAIGSIVARRTEDKEGAIGALIPNCI